MGDLEKQYHQIPSPTANQNTTRSLYIRRYGHI